MSRNLLRAELRVCPQVGFPQSQNIPATSANVGVLRSIERHPPKYAWLDCGSRPVVPVVTIELHNQQRPRYRSVRGELVRKVRLSQIWHSKLIEDQVPRRFGTSHAPKLLPLIHFQQHRGAGRVGVTTLQRAVRNRVCLGSRRRPAEVPAADFAHMLRFIPALMLVVTCQRAKPSLPLGNSARVNVEHRAALPASPFAPCLAQRARRCRAVAGQRAVPAPWPHPPRDNRAAPGTRNRSDLVSRRPFCHNPKSTATNNPIEVMR